MSFAYLFERFPTFTQTFCVREVSEMRRQMGAVPVYSIRRPVGEPPQDFPHEVTTGVVYLPEDIETSMLREAAPLLVRLRRLWEWKRQAKESDRKRVFEALWLGPRLEAHGISHVHVHFAGMGARTAWWLKKLFGITYSFTAHANDIFVGANEKSPVKLDALVAEAKRVATVSDFSQRLLSHRFPEAAERIARVYNGIEVDRFAGVRVHATPPLIIAVGRYIEKKGFRYLIEACAALHELPFQCQIIGEGPLEGELRALIEARGQSKKILVTGPMPEREIISLLHEAKVFVLPCIVDSQGDSDNLPTVIMEAMAAALPVISTPIAGVPEMVIDGETGFLVPENEHVRLADRIRCLLVDSDLNHTMGMKGLERCRRLFDVHATCAELRRFVVQ